MSPAESPDSPDYQAARRGVRVRGGRIVTTLGLLALLSALSGVAGLLGLIWSWRTLPAWLSDLDPTGLAPDLAQVVPAWVFPVLLSLSLLSTLIYVWTLVRARQVIAAIRDHTLDPSAERAAAQTRLAATVRPWITLGQYAPILLTLPGLAAVPLGMALSAQLDPAGMAGMTDAAFGPAEFLLIALSTLIQNLPAIVLTWLILAAVRAWLNAVVARGHDPRVAVRPQARRVEPWLLLTVILLALLAAFTLVSALPFLLLPQWFAAIEDAAPELLTLGLTPEVLGRLGLIGAGLTFGGSLLYVLLATLMAWSRGFAQDVATVLDATGEDQTHPAHDPWTGPVRYAEVRERG